MARSNSSSCRGGWCEVPFDERAARTGLEVLLSGPLPLRLETWGYGETVLHWIASEGWLAVRDEFRN